MKNNLLVILLVLLSLIANAQSSQSIPYQAIVRNTDGTVMSNTNITLTFEIHDISSTGTVVYEESHIVTSSMQGLVAVNVGGGTPISGTFSNINWGNGAKFLQVLMNAGNGTIDLGTQQMMSVPYALYADDVKVRVSNSGDSLFIGEKYSIVPGVSAANPTPLYIQGGGVNDIDGNYYPSIIINGQEWMQKNLAVTKYRNGDLIPSSMNYTEWNNITTGAYSYYSDNLSNISIYGNLYNWYAVNDTRSLCPIGWHVPSNSEWNLLFNYLDSNSNGGLMAPNTVGGKIKSVGTVGLNTGLWMDNNIGANNISGFSALPAGERLFNGSYTGINQIANWWSSTSNGNNSGYLVAYSRFANFDSNSAGLGDLTIAKNGFSVRCIKD
ncbi:MAG: hypothetical protein RLY61_786 [Candidatus Parcubacteria bacterium]|jgi:uncharacterized protein (TIGR02145 family)